MSRLSIAAIVSAMGVLAPVGAAVLQGKITNQSGRALNQAIVKLIPQGISDTTSADGMYSISTGPTSIGRPLVPSNRDVSFRDGVLELTLRSAAPVTVEIFDTKGGMIHSEAFQSASRGVYRMDVAGRTQGNKMLLVKVTIEGSAVVYRYASLSEGGASAVASFAEVGGGLARVAAATDSIVVSAKGYKTRTVAAPSLDATLNVTLDTILTTGGYELKNNPVPTSGCGKSTVKSGTYKMMNRDYTVDVPANYDPNKPSRLIFGMHCMGSSRQGVINDQYYQRKPRDTEKNTIFVAMQGESNGTWQQGINDHKMFEEIHKHLSANLCIDSSRVFSVGFSFGAMFTNSLSRNHQGILRAVVTYSPADYNIYLPPTTIDAPIGYMSTVGLSDGTCPPATGRSCKDLKVKHNKCTVPATVPEATKGSGGHVCYDYQGCPNYPVKFCTFDGGHDDRPKDRNQGTTWVHDLTWTFLKQF